MTTYKPYSNITTAITGLLFLMLVITSCGETAAKKDTEEQTTTPNMPVVEELHLNMPKDEDSVISRPLAKSSLSLILLEDKWYCYNGREIKSGAYCDKKQFRALLLENKKIWGDSLMVVIKPSDRSTYANTVDALDEMAINTIERYALVKLNPEEEKYFQVASGPKKLPDTPLTGGVEKIKMH
jgi:hypothetical protein